jgi:hypothetical protein
MKERLMKLISTHAHVSCADGEAGTSHELIIDPGTKRLTHIVIRERGLEDMERLVPLELVDETSENMIQLRCTRSDLDDLDGFLDARFANALVYRSSPQELSDPWPLTVSRKVPEGKLALGRHSMIEATDDGSVGRLESVVVEADGRITHIIVRTHHFLARQEVAVPVAEVDEFLPNYVYLRLSRADVGRLPHVPKARAFTDEQGSYPRALF